MLRLAEKIAAHAKAEEEVMYPAAILVGEHLKVGRSVAQRTADAIAAARSSSTNTGPNRSIVRSAVSPSTARKMRSLRSHERSTSSCVKSAIARSP